MKSTLTSTAAAFLNCYVLILTFGVAAVIGESNHILSNIAKAQIEEEEGKDVQDEAEEQGSTDHSTAVSNGISLTLDRAHFIPLTPLSGSPGNQLKMLFDYSIQNSSALRDDTVNAVMEVYALNQTLLRTSSLPEPIALEDSEGSIELATTFNDDTLSNVTTRVLLTGDKVFPISDPLEARISLGEIRTAASDL